MFHLKVMSKEKYMITGLYMDGLILLTQKFKEKTIFYLGFQI